MCKVDVEYRRRNSCHINIHFKFVYFSTVSVWAMYSTTSSFSATTGSLSEKEDCYICSLYSQKDVHKNSPMTLIAFCYNEWSLKVFMTTAPCQELWLATFHFRLVLQNRKFLTAHEWAVLLSYSTVCRFFKNRWKLLIWRIYCKLYCFINLNWFTYLSKENIYHIKLSNRAKHMQGIRADFWRFEILFPAL